MRIITRWLLASLLVAAFSAPASRAEDADIVAAGWLDNFTFGGINTAIGVPAALLGWGINGIQGCPPGVHLDSTGQQLVFECASLNPAFEYSTGAIHHAAWDGFADAHEAGHAKQSAVLGPLFLPVVGLTYLTQGMDTGVVERWADAWSDLGSTMKNTRPVGLRFNLVTEDGKGSAIHAGANFALVERSSRLDVEFDDMHNPTAISNKYLSFGVQGAIDLDGHCASKAPLVLEGAILDRKFQAEWATMSDALKLLIDSHEQTGHVVVDFDYGHIDAKLLSQVVGVGLRVGSRKTVAVDAIGRGRAALKGKWLIGDSNGGAKGPGLVATAGIGGELRLHLFDKAELYFRKAKEIGTSGYGLDETAYGAETPELFTATAFTDPDHGGGPTDIHAGIEQKNVAETWRDPAGVNATTHVKMLLLNVNGRF